MSYAPIKLQRVVVTTNAAVVTATWTLLLPSRDRDHLLINWDGSNTIRVYYRNPIDAIPTLATEGTQIDTNYRGDFWDGGAVPVCEVWVYQATGGNISISAREGFQQLLDRTQP